MIIMSGVAATLKFRHRVHMRATQTAAVLSLRDLGSNSRTLARHQRKGFLVVHLR